jgi:hypothetical protein
MTSPRRQQLLDTVQNRTPIVQLLTCSFGLHGYYSMSATCCDWYRIMAETWKWLSDLQSDNKRVLRHRLHVICS